MANLRIVWLAVWWLLIGVGISGCAVTETLQGDNVVGDGSVSLSVPADIIVATVDGKPIESPGFFATDYQVKLHPGKRTLELSYARNWGGDMDYLNEVRWQPISLVFDFSENGNYGVAYQKPKNREEAIALKDKTPIWITAQGIKQASRRVEPVMQTVATKSQTVTPETQATALAQPKAVTPPVAQVAAAATRPESTSGKPDLAPAGCKCANQTEVSNPMDTMDNLQAIKTLWKKLTPDQRKAFWMSIAPN